MILQFGTLLLKAMNAAVEQLSMFGPNKQAPLGMVIFYQTLFKPLITSECNTVDNLKLDYGQIGQSQPGGQATTPFARMPARPNLE